MDIGDIMGHSPLEEHLLKENARLKSLLKRCVPQLRKLKYYEKFMTEPNDLDELLEGF